MKDEQCEMYKAHGGFRCSNRYSCRCLVSMKGKPPTVQNLCGTHCNMKAGDGFQLQVIRRRGCAK